MPPIDDTRTLSVRNLAARWRVAPKRIREMIRKGLLSAFDVGTSRPQLRISPESIVEAERRLAVRPIAPRRRRRDEDIDPEVERLLDSD